MNNAATLNMQQQQQAPNPHLFTLRSARQMSRHDVVAHDIAEDLIDTTSTSNSATESQPTDDVAHSVQPRVTTSTSPEFPTTGLLSSSNFHVRVGLKYEDNVGALSKKIPLDIVCILDNSGSMGGSKLQSLKEAMKFVIGSLGPKDRLSIVYFNSQAGPVHGLLKMTPANKDVSRARLNSINAEGGTDIYDGMRFGWSVLQQRQTHNPASCVFLLTDGQDRGRLEEKKELARSIKANGTSLFVFGFGADHDSEHMTTIAQAAECPFTYIESDDMVVDAFGGSIGTQQGAALRNISMTVSGLSEGVSIAQTMSGSYVHTLAADGRSSTVSFANMYEGESREVVLRLNLPTIAQPVAEYPLVRVTASYTVQDSEGVSSAVRAGEECQCVVRRVTDSELDPAMERDVQVDVQINRIKSTTAIAGALQAADAGNFESAKEILTAASAYVTHSVSFRAGSAVSKGIASDLADALSRVRSRGEYSSGGRAMMSETRMANDQQRSCYTKVGRVNNYQSAGSSSMQSTAFASKAKR